jgi:eukaryotic-like serine/threonine-protein kinase
MHCLSQQDLVELLNGDLSARLLLDAEMHIDSCTLCRSQLASLSHSDSCSESPETAVEFEDDLPKWASDIAQRLQEQLRSERPWADFIRDGKLGRELAVSSELPVIDGYQLIQEIGRGGMGIVYEAIHQQLKRRVALKVLSVTKQHRSAVFTTL